MENSCARGALNSAQGTAPWSTMPPLVTDCVTDAPRKCCQDGADDFLRWEYGSGMKILHEACVITCPDKDDPWRTERRSDGWNVGDVPPNESDTQQRADDSCRRERPKNDWNIGSAFPDETDSVQLALVPVESRNQLGRTDHNARFDGLRGGRARGIGSSPALAHPRALRPSLRRLDVAQAQIVQKTLQQLVLLWGEVGPGFLPKQREQIDGVLGHGQVAVLARLSRRFHHAQMDQRRAAQGKDEGGEIRRRQPTIAACSWARPVLGRSFAGGRG